MEGGRAGTAGIAGKYDGSARRGMVGCTPGVLGVLLLMMRVSMADTASM